MPHGHFTRPTSGPGYLEAMSRIIMTSGMNWKVNEGKWEGIRAAFGGFEVEHVAAMTDEDIERLMTDPRVVRNRRKLHAIVDNAAKVAQVEKQYGGFDKYLDAQGAYEKKVAALKRDFTFMGDSTAYFFLAMAGETVPDWESQPHAEAWRKAHEHSEA